MKSRRSLLFTLVLASAAWAFPAIAQVSLPTDFANDLVVSGLELPNAMAFLPDGRLLLTEQATARVRMVVNGHIAATDPVVTVADVNDNGYERGLQGIAVDPGWPARPYVYVYYNRDGFHCEVARYRAQGDLANPLGENLTLTDRLILIDDIPDNDPNHNAGCLRFAPDGTLFVSLGEDEDECAAYDSTRLKGQLLRIDVASLPDTFGITVPRALITPSQNPLATADSNARLVWAYGMRNPWRFHIDPISGLVYLADVGEAHFEEMNEVAAGDYLGWPYREAHRVMPRSSCPEPGGQGTIAYKAPILALARPPDLTAIVSAGIYRPGSGTGARWPTSYWGDVFYAEYYSGVLRRLKKTNGFWGPAPGAPGQPDPVSWGTGLLFACDFLVGPDGGLWWLRQFNDAGENGTGSLNRIRYNGPDTTSSTDVDLVRMEATPDRVRLEWYSSDTALSAIVYRREPGTHWTALASVYPDGGGLLVYEDTEVTAGRRYVYRLGLGDGRFSGEFTIDVPDRLALAVHGLRVSPSGSRLIAFSTMERGPVALEMFDVNGRRMLERDLGIFEAGEQLVRLDRLELASGVYLARIRQAGRSASGKAIVTR